MRFFSMSRYWYIDWGIATLNEYILEMQNVTKTFPGVVALDNINFRVKTGEVHALCGENGAGKSTLMKILNGIYQADSGTIKINGEQVKINNAQEARQFGLSLIFQEFNLVNTLSVTENIYLGKLTGEKRGLINWKELRQKSESLIKGLGYNIDVRKKVQELSPAEKQMVEIAKAFSVESTIIAMDEPTSSLATNETEHLFKIIETLKASGITIIYISHKLDELFRICDSITVMRDGQIVDTVKASKTSQNELISMMVGRPMSMEFPKREPKIGETILEVSHLSGNGPVEDVSFELHKGEILGIAGLVGSGRTELVEMIFGAAKSDSGEIRVHGKTVKINSPKEGKRNSLGLITEDRKETGLALSYSVVENIVITKLEKVFKGPVYQRNRANQYADSLVESLSIKTPSLKQSIMNLSGGNQQKVVLAKWLFSDVEVLILDEPTRGIDVGAKYEIYLLMNKLVAQGKSIIMISSELPEVLGMSDRVIVMNEGRKKGELIGEDINSEKVMSVAIL